MKKTIEGNVEEEIEDWLPKKTVREVKKRPLIYLIVLVFIIIAIVGLSAGLVLANKSLKEQRNIVSGLNLDLQKKGNELTALQDNLSKTEEGRKQLEQAKNQVEAENQQLDTRASTAEQIASKAKSDLAKTQASLSAKQAELASINEQLAKAQRGVAKFDQTESLFIAFDQSSRRIATYFYEGQKALGNGDMATADYYISLLGPEIDNNNSLYSQISSVFSAIKSGNY
jgi:septal ring factor EnvC (AmiA/AmiB activator)